MVVVCLSSIACASTVDNSVYSETPRINSGDELVSTILNNCYDFDCLKGNVLSYLNTLVNERPEAGRSLNTADVDEAIFNRVARIMNTHEFRVPLPETFFHKSEITYRADRGIDVEISKEASVEGKQFNQLSQAYDRWTIDPNLTFALFLFHLQFSIQSNQTARGDGLKKKLLLPALLLLKLKLKAILPIVVGLIGLKALKALILSKLAITLVVGFIAYSLLKKPAAPAGPDASTPAPASSYEPGWDGANSGGPYARVWDPTASQNIAYSAYYPGSASSSSVSGSSSSTGSSSSSSPSSKYSTI